MIRPFQFLCCGALMLFVASAACGGGDDADNTTPSANATAAGGDDVAAGGLAWTPADAQALLDVVPITAADLVGSWKTNASPAEDNAAAAKNDPRAAASFERCGRLLAQTVVNAPEDQVASYTAGQTASFFSQVVVYETAEGAADCAAEAVVRYQEPGELAKAFKSIFMDPAAVMVTTVEYPQVADGSFASNLTGKFAPAGPNGTIVDLTILIVAFRQGNVTAVVGSAAASAPSVEELRPLVDLVLKRITDAQR
jgi:hypothetical protein